MQLKLFDESLIEYTRSHDCSKVWLESVVRWIGERLSLFPSPLAG